MNEQTVKHLILIISTLFTVTVLSTILRKLINSAIKKNSKILGVSPTTYVFLKNSLSFILYSIGIFWIFYNIPYFKTLGSALFAGAGVFAAVIAFASQKAFSNIISGIFILIFKPFRVGDIIEIANGKKGIVESITLRHTVIRDFEFMRVVIPNSVISEDTIINSTLTDEKIRKHIEIGISYESDIDTAIDIIRNVIQKHPLTIDNRTPEEIEINEPIVGVRLVGLGDFSVTLKAYVWVNNSADAFTVYTDSIYFIKQEFAEKGIDIPYPHRTIVFKDKNITSDKL